MPEFTVIEGGGGVPDKSGMAERHEPAGVCPPRGETVIEGHGVSTTVLAGLAGVSVQAVRLACRSGSLDARRDRRGAWQIQAAAAVRYATEHRAGAARRRDPRPGDVTISLAAGEVRALFPALSLAGTFMRRRPSRWPGCRVG